MEVDVVTPKAGERERATAVLQAGNQGQANSAWTGKGPGNPTAQTGWDQGWDFSGYQDQGTMTGGEDASHGVATQMR